MGNNILIVDDAAFMRMMVKDILTKGGYNVVGEAENGLVAVQKYSELKPDLITLDITMPEMDGIQALKAFSLGGGNITADLSEVLKLKFAEAEKLKTNMVLSLEPTETEVYTIETSSGAKPIKAKTANEVVEKRIEQIASFITKCINGFENISPQTPIYLTGGGITKFKGAKDYLSKLIARKIIVAKGSSLEYREPDNAAAISLLNFAILISEGRGV